MTSLQSFTPFPSLPAELRLKIWEFSIEPRVVREGCHFKSMRSGKLPHQSLPAIFRVNWESRGVAFEEYEPFMGTYLHLKFDILCIQGLYLDYLGPDMVALDDIDRRLDAPPRMTLRSPFDRVRVMFTGPWSTGCDCYTTGRSKTPDSRQLQLPDRTGSEVT